MIVCREEGWIRHKCIQVDRVTDHLLPVKFVVYSRLVIVRRRVNDDSLLLDTVVLADQDK